MCAANPIGHKQRRRVCVLNVYRIIIAAIVHKNNKKNNLFCIFGERHHDEPVQTVHGVLCALCVCASFGASKGFMVCVLLNFCASSFASCMSFRS